MNITDVDDKTIKGSQAEKVSLNEFTERYTKSFFEDLDKLNIENAAVFPKATEHVKEMVAIVKKLLEKGIAYKGEDGSIYYDISKFKDYGKLSGSKITKLKAGARVSQDEYEKENANDFALWKSYTKEDGDVFWDTELGKGRPGWHIECSAMSTKYLGNHFDIHTGGIDLVFPHHENEIAQSEGANDEEFVKYWVHNEYLQVNGKKMSKSLGNFFTLRDLLKKGYSAKAIRYLLLSANYRVQFNFTEEGLNAAENTIQKLQDFVAKVQSVSKDGEETTKKLSEEAVKKFEEHMDDDLNISSALAAVFDYMREVNKIELTKKDAAIVLDTMKKFDMILGVINFEKEVLAEDIDALIQKREDARKAKDYATADKIRDDLKAKGIVLEDTKDGVRWKKA